MADPPRAGGEVAGRILGGEPDLDGMAHRRRGPVRGGQDGVRQGPAGGQAELLRDDVEAGDELRDAVLDLEPGVDLEEPGRAVRPAKELGGRGVLETRGGRDLDRAVVEVAALVGRQARRRRLLDQLLVATLERAVPLPDGDDAPDASPSSWTSMWRAGRMTRSR